MLMKYFLILLSLFALNTNAQGRERFGFSGRDGRSGSSGLTGISGPSFEYFATGGQQLINLDGTRGGDALDGEDGQNAYGCFQKLADFDLLGADGGNAGKGGDGGSGGQAGNPTIYYQDIGQLKNILISAIGGEGGRGARAGRAGRGCQCEQRRWEVARCTEKKDKDGKPVKICEKVFHDCRDGDNGFSTSSGRNGISGNNGTLTLIKSAQRLQGDHPSEKINFAALMPSASVSLTENIFDTRSGASTLFAGGSRLNDTYFNFRERAEQNISVIWKAQRELASFAQNMVSTKLQTGFTSAVIEGDDVFLTQLNQSPGQLVLSVNEAYHREELKQLEVKLEGTAQDVVLSIKDKSLRQDLLKDTIRLNIYRKRFILGFHKVYDGLMPADLMQKSGDTLYLRLGRMNFQEAVDTFNKGTTIKVELNMDRLFNNAYTINFQNTSYDDQK